MNNKLLAFAVGVAVGFYILPRVIPSVRNAVSV